MTEIDLSRAEWRKRSFGSQSGHCVEVARNLPGLVAVRDSKEPYGAKLVVSQGDLAGAHQRPARLATYPPP